MQALFTITQSPQTLAGDAVRPAAPTLKKLTSILAAYLGPMRLLGAAFPLGDPAASILVPTSNSITQSVQQSSTLSSKEKVEFPLYLTHR
jgi:hypothetical protein